MLRVLLACALVCFSQAFERNTELEWESWTRRFGKRYATAEAESASKAVWLQNAALVDKHNSLPGASFRMGLNAFSDQVPVKRPKVNVPNVVKNTIPNTVWRNPGAPDEFDWRKKGVVPPVENQGQLGSAMAYAARDAVVSYAAIHTGAMYNLSVPEVADCCGTNLAGPVFQCVHDLGGLCLARDYKAANCSSRICKPVAQVEGGKSIGYGDEATLQLALLEVPVIAVIDASHPSFQLYQSGVYNEPSCSSSLLDHTLLMVGYGTDSSGNDFWICKNSWGKSWGMQGYVLMSRNKNNQCGIASAARYPV